ncbi:Hsp20/alpha crystallin family protein [Caldimonas caldifontis]|uniref:Heat-shock protein Hsp20 n=1 Tax=Caldimonas caldifontis TaxID=1452508 RepID=A0A2S5SVH1_9BURK|nr:Hsp20/alpha crystallin family protein [Caldimonas caldifontis]PPE66704.1 heat-shock protein Hsp20 [Caldimonas caldifontis]
MTMKNLREGFDSLWDSLSEGWTRLRDSARGALTRFNAGDQANLPDRSRIDDSHFTSSQGWALIGGDVYEDENRLVVRLEVPGMDKKDFDVQVRDDLLIVRGEKRFEQESSDGRWRVLQCAYGSFERSVPLPVAVKAEQAQARYRDGVLRIELPKARPGAARSTQLKVS